MVFLKRGFAPLKLSFNVFLFRRGNGYVREDSPLFDSPLVFSPSKERGAEVLKGRSPSIFPY